MTRPEYVCVTLCPRCGQLRGVELPSRKGHLPKTCGDCVPAKVGSPEVVLLYYRLQRAAGRGISRKPPHRAASVKPIRRAAKMAARAR